MNGSHGVAFDVEAGAKVTIVAYSDAAAKAIVGTVESSQPLTILTNDKAAEIFKTTKHALILLGQEPSFERADASVESYEVVNGSFKLVFVPTTWEALNKRNHPRIPVSVPASVRAVTETEDSVTVGSYIGVTEDLSMGGAWIKMENALEPGTLVEFQTKLPEGTSVRTLAIIAHYSHERQGVGVQFVDYIGSARYDLHTFLCKVA